MKAEAELKGDFLDTDSERPRTLARHCLARTDPHREQPSFRRPSIVTHHSLEHQVHSFQ